MRNVAFTSLLTSLGLLASTASYAACDPRVVVSPTQFPERSLARGQAGVVLLEVTVDALGRVSGTQLLRSSGFRLLDRAAVKSVRQDWVFDVSSCARQDLPASDRITVEYRRDS